MNHSKKEKSTNFIDIQLFFSVHFLFSIFYDVILLTFDVLLLIVKIIFFVFKSLYENLRGVQERDVSNDIVLITGTGHGIGKELALQYSQLGSTVVCWDVNETSNKETVELIKSTGCKAHGFT